ncbi:allophycocyanin beta subunit (plasmid) [Nostoc sp. NIES-2111]|nr:allophycocyanin beta subunit [Nostoc sp. NIES-2111]
MKDIVHAIIASFDIQGKYIDASAIEKISSYYQTGELRVRIAATIGANASAILKEVISKSLLYTDVTQPGGNMYTTRRFSSCIRDLEYFLRYATYALLSGDTSILDERVLNGLKETYQSLGVPIDATIRAIEAMKEVTASLLDSDGGKEIAIYLDYIISGLDDGQSRHELFTTLNASSHNRVAPEAKPFEAILYNEQKVECVEYTEDDLFGLITGNEGTLKKFGYRKEEEEFLNKGLFTSMLGDFNTSKASDYLRKLLFWKFSDGAQWKSNNFAAVDEAAAQIRHKCLNRKEVVDIFIKGIKEGNYAAKIACCYQGSYMIEEAFLEPIKELAQSKNDEKMREYAAMKLKDIQTRLKTGSKEVDIYSYKIPSLPE